MLRWFVFFPIQYFSELWNLMVFVLMHRTQYFLSCVKTYPGKEKKQKKENKRTNSIR